jgi:hypothetical protein
VTADLFQCMLVGDGFGVVSDLVLRWAGWWLVEEVICRCLGVFWFGWCPGSGGGGGGGLR